MPKTPQHLSTKRNLIDKANSNVVLVTAAAAFVIVFSLMASKALASQAAYQNRVISGKKDAVKQLKADVQATSSLVSSYKAFVGTPQNVLGGNPAGNGDKDGDNGKIILDALPSKYDFPALASSLQKLVNAQSLQIQNITGTDEEITQGSNQTSPTPSPVAMPFQLTVSGGYKSIQNLVGAFQHSIRPFQIQTMELSGNESSMTLTITAQTFYQPGKSLNITTKEVQ